MMSQAVRLHECDTKCDAELTTVRRVGLQALAQYSRAESRQNREPHCRQPTHWSGLNCVPRNRYTKLCGLYRTVSGQLDDE